MMNTKQPTSTHEQRAAYQRFEESMNNRFSRMRQLVLQQKRQHSRQIQKLREQNLQPVAELAENSDYIRLTVDLPGVLANDLVISVEEGVLSIAASRKTMSIDKSSCLKKQKISRRYAINTDVVNSDKLEAHLAHGVLTVNAPKRGKAHHLINVEADSDQENSSSPTKIHVSTSHNGAVKVTPTIAHSVVCDESPQGTLVGLSDESKDADVKPEGQSTGKRARNGSSKT